ncbi:glycoside hydrolase family 43 protein [Dothidotthia symphoricarpi CBS 119687]|uniref:Arabinan endo-1,5-alpha-L-arabinosidase n=1 Tax=Dothidotthia symphoricarpi CBS 119687 TaxID=1392245 RepID=A0A6A6AMK6_9PLEO|nr:glycoside hydrolase family 43 protein [Dothidotthia symphoricarpi CBS 119687]KAF2132117.1 glycoside hydrolase family 43 protein [Dothidotthia symphoricarpi CBS 119687]
MRTTAALSLLSLWSVAVDAYANPLACSGTCTNAHDPSLVRRDDGTYFRFSTGGKVAIHTSPTLQGPWTYKGAAIPAGSIINKTGKDDLWAPDVVKIGSTYYLYYSVSAFGENVSAIGVATSTTMEVGSWTDHGTTGVESTTSNNFNAIDGQLQVVDSKYYLNFGSFWSDLFQIEMASPPLKAAKAVTSATNIAFVPTSPQAQEAAFTYKNGSYYYLFFSVGSCCGYDTSRPAAGKEYKIQVCRSTSVSGPYVDKAGTSCLSGGGTTVLESHGTVYGPGGQGVLTVPELGPVLYYHYVDTTIGYADGQKQFGVNTMSFSTGWPVV